MFNSVFQQLQKPNLMNSFQSFMQNPFEALVKSRLNIPNEYMNDPHSASQYLVSSGQISQEQFNKAYQTAQQMGINL